MRFRNVLMVVSAASLTVAASIACSSSSSTPSTAHDGGNEMTGDGGEKKDAGSGPAKATDAEVSACMASGSAVCDLQAKCNPRAHASVYGDGGACASRNAIDCEARLTAPGTADTLSHTTACTGVLATETCVQDLDLQVPSQCDVNPGKGATGSACSESAQCGSAFCAVAPQSNCGKCQTAPKAGDSCANLVSCGTGLTCAANTCAAFVTDVLGACSPTEPCGTGLDCVTASGATTGKCQTSAFMVGAACDPTLETSAGCYTQLGYYCVANKKDAKYQTCQMVATATAGEACGRIKAVQTDCVGATCFKGAGGDAGSTCLAHAADNAKCDTVSGPDCNPPSRCIGTLLDGGTSGTCVLPGTFTCP